MQICHSSEAYSFKIPIKHIMDRSQKAVQLSCEYKERTRVVLFFHLITMNLMTLEKAERVVKGRRG